MAKDLIRQIVDDVVDEIANSTQKVGALTVDGQTPSTIDQFKTLLAEKLRSATPESSPGGSSYLSFVALLNQSGADEPVITELENTIGNIPVFRLDIGKYRFFGDVGTKTENSKIWMSSGVNVTPTTDNNLCAAVPVINNDMAELVGYYRFYILPDDTRLIFQMDCYDKDFLVVDISELTQNEINLPEIRVYP